MRDHWLGILKLRRRRAANRSVLSRYAIESLECRVLLTTFTVTNLNDSGPGSLRDAISQSNADAGGDTIVFAPTLSGTITLSRPLELANVAGPVKVQRPRVERHYDCRRRCHSRFSCRQRSQCHDQ